ncbi:hypothetical protein EZV73_01645 [Acidaminobacter sp. JC074]|uniref:hypothetical protein n=1 Tax=Acidaminobacter sp. JC074 TaxID=2530199 RepID=UPI001F0E3BA2|nr:hypothetical protein [Acidaminobacter sp. JC074]MCH4886248.1 hypothetical protein [Acidaminobacter sp. JC074]
MKIFIAQPKLSNNIDELLKAIEKVDCDCILFPEGYIALEGQLDQVVDLAKTYGKSIVTSYRRKKSPRDMAILINERGNLIFDREKSSVEGPLLLPSTGIINKLNVGYLLCREIFLDYNKLLDSDIIFNPIGVGMFSHEQLIEWTTRAKQIAIDTRSILIGTSHSDGSYRDCGFSLPVSFVYDSEGNVIHESIDDARSVLIDLGSREVEYINI